MDALTPEGCKIRNSHFRKSTLTAGVLRTAGVVLERVAPLSSSRNRQEKLFVSELKVIKYNLGKIEYPNDRTDSDIAHVNTK